MKFKYLWPLIASCMLFQTASSETYKTVTKKKLKTLTKTYSNNLRHFESKSDSTKKEEDAIKAVLMDYIEGTSNGDPTRLKKVFHPDLNLYSVNNFGELNIWHGQDYIKVFKEGEKNNRKGKILSVDYENNAAIAKVEILSHNSVFIDYFLLLKLNTGWTIIHKSYTRK